MMKPPLYIAESDIPALIDMKGAIAALDSIFREQGDGGARNSPRQRAEYWGGKLNMMSAGARSGRFAFKAYAGTRAPTVFHVMLYDVDHGLLAIIEANALGQLRTGAASGLATDRLAAPSVSSLGVIGTGRQAAAQIRAVAAVRDLQDVRVFGRDRARLEDFCERISGELGLNVNAAPSAAACIEAARIIVTATDSSTPIVEDEWIAADAHVNAMGANAASRRELPSATYERAGLIVTDDRAQARLEAGEIIDSVESGTRSWNDIRELSDIVAPDWRRQSRGLTIFKSLGAALEDLAVASAVYDRAIALNFDRRVR